MSGDEEEDGLAASLRRAQEVLDRAREIRRAVLGPAADAEEPPLPSDPTERAAEILRRAAAVREEAREGGRMAREREARAREELERIHGTPPADPDEPTEPPRPSPVPRRREL